MTVKIKNECDEEESITMGRKGNLELEDTLSNICDEIWGTPPPCTDSPHLQIQLPLFLNHIYQV